MQTPDPDATAMHTGIPVGRIRAVGILRTIRPGALLDASNSLGENADTNDVWMIGDEVLRVSKRRRGSLLYREVLLSRILPDAVGYPTLRTSGRYDGYDWMLMERVEGDVLAKAWSGYNAMEAEGCIADLMEHLEAIHTIPKSDYVMLNGRAPYWYPITESASERLIFQLMKNGVLNEQQSALARVSMDKMRAQLPTQRVLVHGDYHQFNILVKDARVSAVLDFEAAGVGPADLDLELMLRLFTPMGGYGFPYRDAIKRIAEHAPELYETGAQDRIEGYAVARALRSLSVITRNVQDPFKRDMMVSGWRAFLEDTVNHIGMHAWSFARIAEHAPKGQEIV